MIRRGVEVGKIFLAVFPTSLIGVSHAASEYVVSNPDQGMAGTSLWAGLCLGSAGEMVDVNRFRLDRK